MPHKYEALNRHPYIKKVEVIKETPQTITIKNEPWSPVRRKKSNIFFDTWDEAKAELISRAEIRCKDLRDQLQRANEHLGNIKGLKEEKDAV